MPRPVRRLLSTAAGLSLVAAGLIGPGGSALAGGSAAAAPSGAPATGSAASYRTTTLNFKVRVGADRSTACNIVGDLYLPRTASRRNRVPAVLTTNGFGGSKDDQAPMAKMLAARGYAVLSYSGLGFGGSTCKITLDDPDVDGIAARQLVSYLGGKRGIAYEDADHTEPAPRLRVIRRDRRDHRGHRSRHDPRVGMFGGSYGGQIQFAAASVDPRIDALAPSITWNDLSYSLGPNNTGQHGVSSATTGSVKLFWGLGFSGLGMVQGLLHAPDDPGRMLPCPNFATFVCPALVTGAVTGGFDHGTVQKLRHASVASYVDRIRVPVLLMQGQSDTLFNLNEGVATYRALRRQGTPVKMIWQWGGHSGAAAPGEQGTNPARNYLTGRTLAWFERYLKDRRVGTGPRFAYFRDWVEYDGNARPAYARSGSFPVGSRRTFHLSRKRLVRRAGQVERGNQTFVTPVAGLPTSLDRPDAVPVSLPEVDLPGTFASWTGPRLDRPMDVVGSPRLRIKVNAPVSRLTGAVGYAGQLVLFAKLMDVGPDGKGTVVRNLVAPVRVADPTKPFTVTLPAIVHRFAKGHRLRLVLAGGSSNYRGNLTPTTVTVRTGGDGGDGGQVLSVPVLP